MTIRCVNCGKHLYRTINLLALVKKNPNANSVHFCEDCAESLRLSYCCGRPTPVTNPYILTECPVCGKAHRHQNPAAEIQSQRERQKYENLLAQRRPF